MNGLRELPTQAGELQKAGRVGLWRVTKRIQNDRERRVKDKIFIILNLRQNIH